MNLPTEPPPNPGMAAGGYVHRPSRTERHTCPLPAEWEVGAVWRCPEGHLWFVERTVFLLRYGYAANVRRWSPAGWWMRRRYGGKRARVEMANGNRFAPRKPPRAPQTPGGIQRGVETVPGIPPPVPWTPQDPDAPPKDFDG